MDPGIIVNSDVTKHRRFQTCNTYSPGFRILKFMESDSHTDRHSHYVMILDDDLPIHADTLNYEHRGDAS